MLSKALFQIHLTCRQAAGSTHAALKPGKYARQKNLNYCTLTGSRYDAGNILMSGKEAAGNGKHSGKIVGS
jgi:hypothetical protein